MNKNVCLTQECIDQITIDNLVDTWRLQTEQIRTLEAKDCLKKFEMEDLANMRKTRLGCGIALEYFYGHDYRKKFNLNY